MSGEHPKAVIVKSSTLTKYGRMDAGFYIGLHESKRAQEELEAAEKRLEAAKRAVDNKKAKLVEDRKRVKAMEDRGEVVPFTGD